MKLKYENLKEMLTKEEQWFQMYDNYSSINRISDLSIHPFILNHCSIHLYRVIGGWSISHCNCTSWKGRKFLTALTIQSSKCFL